MGQGTRMNGAENANERDRAREQTDRKREQETEHDHERERERVRERDSALIPQYSTTHLGCQSHSWG